MKIIIKTVKQGYFIFGMILRVLILNIEILIKRTIEIKNEKRLKLTQT